ncbi:MAG: FAD-binding protein [Pseudomonadales bacterium]|nr:FAD-binding protein [Pseudomonadales bacterium]
MSYSGSQYDETTGALLAPPDYVNPKPQPNYHLVVVGAGPAGLIASIGAAGLGAKVALIEKHRMGGDCLNVGCVPSKAILTYTENHPDADFQDAFSFARQIRAEIAPHDSVDRYTDLGVDVFLGEAKLPASGKVQVGDQVLAARRVLICTGAQAAIPPIPGLSEVDPLTNETVFDLTEQPQSIGILGAGVIGCELAQAFARLGTKVHLFEMADRVLPLEDNEASQVVHEALKRSGVALHLASPVQRIETVSGTIEVQTEHDSKTVERILVALGRKPNTANLALQSAGVAVDEFGFVVTDQKLRSTNKTIFAAGDCTSKYQFTHNADAQARVVVQNALFAATATTAKHVVPRCIYTSPEVAAVGLSERELLASGVEYDVYRVEFSELDRGRVQVDTEGFAKVFTKVKSDEILGACIVGRDAGEQLAGICILMSNGLGLAALGGTILSYPTRSEFLKRLADGYNRTRMTPFVAKLFSWWLSFTGKSDRA